MIGSQSCHIAMLSRVSQLAGRVAGFVASKTSARGQNLLQSQLEMGGFSYPSVSILRKPTGPE